MTEKELSRIINPVARFVQISVANRSSGQTIFSSSDQIQADIARQLTRLADLAEPTKLILTDIPAPDAPTDGLVEAVKNIIPYLQGLDWGAINSPVFEDLVEKLKAAHEKAVR